MYFIIQLTIYSINEIYIVAAQVKCSLTGSDDDSNRVPIQLEGYFYHKPRRTLDRVAQVTFGIV
jgi:hypothetical protein